MTTGTELLKLALDLSGATSPDQPASSTDQQTALDLFNLIVDEWLWLAVTSPGAIPSRLRDLRANLKRFILPPRRSER